MRDDESGAPSHEALNRFHNGPDVLSWELCLLDQKDVVSRSHQPCRGSRSRGPAADHEISRFSSVMHSTFAFLAACLREETHLLKPGQAHPVRSNLVEEPAVQSPICCTSLHAPPSSAALANGFFSFSAAAACFSYDSRRS